MKGSSELVSIIIPVRNERENIEILIRALYNQSYRPIEVVVVDGGSTDGTLEILRKLEKSLEGEGFRLKVLEEKDFGSLRSSSNARNIGIMNSSGEYIIFLDADMVPIDRDFVKNVKIGLDMNPWVSVKAKPIIDTSIEKAIVSSILARGQYVHEYCAVRRSVFKDRLFDPHLGFSEDKDFFVKYLRESLGIKPLLVDTYIGRHEPHTLKEFFKQQKWYGRTCLLYARKNLSPIDTIKLVIRPFICPLSLLLIIAILALGLPPPSMLLALAILVLLVVREVNSYLRTPPEHRSLIVLLTRRALYCFIAPSAYGYGLLNYLMRRKKIEIGRD